jgi:hypothetical protein
MLDFWLWELTIQSAIELIWDLIFPQPVADATLPPRYITPPDVISPPEGGQCPKAYYVDIKRDSTMPPSLASSANWLQHGPFSGPLGSPSLTGVNRSRFF